MTLLEISRNLAALGDELYIYARRPWTRNSECELVSAYPAPVAADVKARGFEHFLGLAVAHEVCEVFGDQPPSSEEIADLLLFYAEHDAFPDWVYER